MERYIVKYLIDSTQDEWRKRYYDYMRFLFDYKFWLYGRHMYRDLESELERKNNVILCRDKIYSEILRRCYKHIKRRINAPFKKVNQNKKETYNAPTEYQYEVLSIFRYPWLSEEAIRELNALGIKIDCIYDKDNKIWSKSITKLQQWYDRRFQISQDPLTF